MIQHACRDSSTGAAEDQRSSRREILTRSLTFVGAGAIAVASARWTAPVAAQDEGLGAGGRQGGDDGTDSSLPMVQNEGLGAGGRQGGDDGGGRQRRRDDAEAPDGVGGGGRSTTAPMVTHMPQTGAGTMENAAASGAKVAAPLLLVAGAVGAAAMALKTRTQPAATSRD